MKNKSNKKTNLHISISLICAAIIVAVDQISKYLIVKYLITEGNSVTVIRGLLDFTLSYNDGMAFGIGSQAFRWIFVAVMLFVGAVLIYLMFSKKHTEPLFLTASALVIGGGLGNAIDRIVNGYVVDFLSLSFFPPICNVADYAITLGTVCLLIFVIFIYGKKPKDTDSDISQA